MAKAERSWEARRRIPSQAIGLSAVAEVEVAALAAVEVEVEAEVAA